MWEEVANTKLTFCEKEREKGARQAPGICFTCTQPSPGPRSHSPMATAGLYRRVLPSPPAIEFSSPQGKQLFSQALGQGTLEGFFNLISYYQTQSEPAFCGLATLSMVLNALAIDPGRTWKGPWRWFEDSMLDCCEPLAKVKTQGITFGKVACLAVCNGAQVEPFWADQSNVDDFRKNVLSCVTSQDRHVIVSYTRKVFKQTGSGHFSPIGGYHAEKDMVLILDVARFKYPPHWVPLTLLWDAMNTLDEASGRCRGFMIISRHHRAPSILYTVSCKNENWDTVAKYLKVDVPKLLTSADFKSIEDMLSVIFKVAPDELREFIKWVAEIRKQEDGSISEEERGRLILKEEILKQIRETELFKHVNRWLALETAACQGMITSSSKDVLSNIAANACCQGAELFTGKICLSDEFSCKEANVKIIRTEKEKPVTVVSGTVTTESTQEIIDTLIPLSHTGSSGGSCSCDKNCRCYMHPSTSDALTVLLLLMPQENWSNIKEEKLQAIIKHLVSLNNLPPLLQEEVLHLRRQLKFLMNDLCSYACSAYALSSSPVSYKN